MLFCLSVRHFHLNHLFFLQLFYTRANLNYSILSIFCQFSATSSATTANPLPASPALAVSMAAFKDSTLSVSISCINSIIVEISFVLAAKAYLERVIYKICKRNYILFKLSKSTIVLFALFAVSSAIFAISLSSFILQF